MSCKCDKQASEIFNNLNPKYASIKIQTTISLLDKEQNTLIYIPVPNAFCPICGVKNSINEAMRVNMQEVIFPKYCPKREEEQRVLEQALKEFESVLKDSWLAFRKKAYFSYME